MINDIHSSYQPCFLIKTGLELLNDIIYNGTLNLTSNFNGEQLINYV